MEETMKKPIITLLACISAVTVSAGIATISNKEYTAPEPTNFIGTWYLYGNNETSFTEKDTLAFLTIEKYDDELFIVVYRYRSKTTGNTWNIEWGYATKVDDYGLEWAKEYPVRRIQHYIVQEMSYSKEEHLVITDTRFIMIGHFLRVKPSSSTMYTIDRNKLPKPAETTKTPVEGRFQFSEFPGYGEAFEKAGNNGIKLPEAMKIVEFYNNAILLEVVNSSVHYFYIVNGIELNYFAANYNRSDILPQGTLLYETKKPFSYIMIVSDIVNGKRVIVNPQTKVYDKAMNIMYKFGIFYKDGSIDWEPYKELIVF